MLQLSSAHLAPKQSRSTCKRENSCVEAKLQNKEWAGSAGWDLLTSAQANLLFDRVPQSLLRALEQSPGLLLWGFCSCPFLCYFISISRSGPCLLWLCAPGRHTELDRNVNISLSHAYSTSRLVETCSGKQR